MASKQRFAWLISPKSFIQLIGAEYDILRKSGSRSLLKFYVSAVTILFILLISACSIFYAMELLFHMPHVEFILALFVSILFVFIYIFLLNTFSKNLFKEKEANEIKVWYRWVRLSDIIRTGFVVFMVFLISKPIEVFIFKKELHSKVKKHRSIIFNEFKLKLDSLNNKDVRKLEASIAFYQKQSLTHPSPTLQEQIRILNAKISAIKARQADILVIANQRIDKSDFLLFRIKQVSWKVVGWLICLLMVFLFILPGYLIYSISATDVYYKLKRDYEISMVIDEHKAFENLYTDIFLRRYQLDIVYYSKYLDPPFNNKRKPDPKFQSQKDFLKKIWQ